MSSKGRSTCSCPGHHQVPGGAVAVSASDLNLWAYAGWRWPHACLLTRLNRAEVLLVSALLPVEAEAQSLVAVLCGQVLDSGCYAWIMLWK